MISRRSRVLISGVALAPLTLIVLAFQLNSLAKEGESYEPPPYLVRFAPVFWWMFVIGCLSGVGALISLISDNRRPR
jgi:hypothetical protein